MWCEFCNMYQCADKRVVEIESGEVPKINYYRYCTTLKKNVEFNSESCGKFSLTDFFYCRKKNQRLKPDLCLSRRKNGYEGCVRGCRQGKFLEGEIDGRRDNK
uniref:Uncharacterized protein n=1 Tax=viral metagenome TaxID=1070528 RepID=A0A6H1ZA61_9ZZZZ